ncbi:MAG TPA: ATP-binding protein [Blastocatellia bacterium]|jgi:two-component system sensor histidine kinase KdpD|nr:ATP-binding protein [Blastocatellia bacterium]
MTSASRQNWIGLGLALAGVIGVTLLYSRFLTDVKPTTVALSLLLVVLAAASKYGLGPSIAASVAGMFCFNYFFLAPVGTLTIHEPQDWIALFTFLITAVTASQLSSAARARARDAERRREEMLKLYQLSRAIIATPDSETAIASVAGQVAEVFGFGYCAVYVPSDAGKWRRLAIATELSFEPAQPKIDRAFNSGDVTITPGAVITDEALPGMSATYAPLKVGVRSVGVMVLISHSLERNTVEAIAGLVALALERARFLTEVSRTEALRQSERLKSALLDAVTHDIRTPLTSIKASVTTLLEELRGRRNTATLDAEGRTEMLEVIDEEADRLNRFVEGLIELARIEAGEMQLQRRWGAVDEIVLAALSRAEPLTRKNAIEVSLEPDLPLVRVDAHAVAEVVYTLVDNAAKYSPPGSRIRVAANRTGDDMVRLAVENEGAGIPVELRERVFDKFFRAMRDGDSGTSGTGMGLAIARGIVEAHGGRIWVEDRSAGRGTVVALTLPVGDKEEAAELTARESEVSKSS